MTFEDGATTLGTESLSTGSSTAFAHSVHFDGSSTVNMGDLGTLPVEGAISMWINADVVEDYDNVLSTSGGDAGNYGIRFEEHADGHFYVTVGNAAYSFTGDTYTSSFTADSWHHVVLSWDTSATTNNLQGYFDGSHVFDASQTLWPTDLDNVQVGTGWYSRYWHGSVDELLFFNRGLDSTDVSTLYGDGSGYYGTTSSGPCSSGLLAGYHFDEDTGTTAADFSGNSHNGTLEGATWGAGYVPAPAEIATLETSSLTLGSHVVTADYGGDTTYSEASSSIAETVVNESSASLSTSPDSPVDQGEAVTLTATIDGESAGTPTGVVKFYGPDSLFLGSAPLSPGSGDTATATLTTTELPAGTDETLSALYMGNADFASSSGPTTITVLPVVAPALNASANPVTFGQSVTLTATMPGDATGEDINFYDGSAPLGTESLTAGSSTAFAHSVHFNGSSTVDVGDLGTLPAQGAISMWVNADTVEDYDNALCTAGAYGGNQGIRFEEHGGGLLSVVIGDDDATWSDGYQGHVFTDTGFVAHEWYHVVVTWDESCNTVSGYLNGVDVFDDSQVDWPSTLNNIQVGSGWEGRYWQGSVDELLFFNKGLTSTEVHTLYGEGSPYYGTTTSGPCSSGLIAGYHFDEGAGTTAADFSGNGHNGTLDGATWGAGYVPAPARIATLMTSDLGIGSNSITASYTSDGTYGDSTSAALPVVVLDTSLPSAIANAPPNQAPPSPVTDGSLALPFGPAGLNYVSNSVGNATVAADATFDASDYSYFAATLTLSQDSEEVASNTVYFGTNDISGDASYRFTVPIDGLGIPTGVYDYSMVITPYSSGDVADSENVATVTGKTNVLNRTDSIFGQGWNLDGLDQLVFDPSGYNVTYVQSDGTMGYFLSSDGVHFDSPAGPFAFKTLALVTVDDTPVYELTGTDGSMESFDHETGALIHITDHDGNVTTFHWSGTLLASIVDPAGHETDFGNDGTLITSITDFAERETDLSYNEAGHLTSVTEPDPEYSGESQPASYFGYDSSTGLLNSYEDANGNTTGFTYGADDRLASVIAADGSTVGYQSAISPIAPGVNGDEGAAGSTTVLAVPLVLSNTAVGVVTDQSRNPTVYTFDTFGNPTSVENALGQTTVYQRDGNGLVSEMDQPNATQGDSNYGETFDGDGYTVGPKTTYSYDSYGVMEATDQYDSNGVQIGMQSWTLSYYSALTTTGAPYDAITANEDSLEHTTEYAIDSNNGDVLSVTQFGDENPVTSYTYTQHSTETGAPPAGLVLTKTDADGRLTQYTYSSEGLLTQIDYPYDANTPASHEWFQYDTADNLVEHTDVLGSSADDAANTTTYAYDNLGRMVSETDPADSDTNSPQTLMLYDPMGNVTSKSVLQSADDSIWETTTYSYNTLEQLSEVDAPGPDGSSAPAVTSYTYTRTGMPYQIMDATGGVTTYSYDFLGEQLSVSGPDPATGLPGGPTTSYAYDALGRETAKTDPLLNTTSYSYVYIEGDNPVADLLVTTTPADTATSPVTMTYDADGHTIGELDTIVAPSSPYADDGTANGTSYLFDGLGRPAQVPDPGDATKSLGPTYDPLGNLLTNTDAEGTVVTTNVYDARNRVIASYGPSPAAAPTLTPDTVTLDPAPGDWAGLTEGVYSTTVGGASAIYDFSDLTPGRVYEVLVTWQGAHRAIRRGQSTAS